MGIILELVAVVIIVLVIIRRTRSRRPQLQPGSEGVEKIPQLDLLEGLTDRVAELERRVGIVEEGVEFNTQMLLRKGETEERAKGHPRLHGS